MTEIEKHMNRDEAERITERIRLDLDAAARSLDRLSGRIQEAHERRADLALGYESWAEYAAGEFGEVTAGLTATVRRQLVGQLSGEGMSTRAIAPAVGVSRDTVSKDRARQVSDDLTPDSPAPEPRKVTGLDGKTYTPRVRPAPEPVTVDHETGEIAQTKPNRKPITDAARDIGLDLNALTDRIDRLMNDDRFDRNRDDIAARLRHHIATATATLNALDSKIN